MNRFSVEKIRRQYLLHYIRHLGTRREVLETDVASLDWLRQRTLEKIGQDIAECRAYDMLLKDVADHQIAYDLDDGVAVNHAKFTPVVAAIR